MKERNVGFKIKVRKSGGTHTHTEERLPSWQEWQVYSVLTKALSGEWVAYYNQANSVHY